jgi:hypothetical protein
VEVRGGALRMKCIWALKNEAPVAGQRGWGVRGGGGVLPVPCMLLRVGKKKEKLEDFCNWKVVQL